MIVSLEGVGVDMSNRVKLAGAFAWPKCQFFSLFGYTITAIFQGVIIGLEREVEGEITGSVKERA